MAWRFVDVLCLPMLFTCFLVELILHSLEYFFKDLNYLILLILKFKMLAVFLYLHPDLGHPRLCSKEN